MPEIISYETKLFPINRKSYEILKKKEFAFIGISPFNSYFSVKKIYEILQSVEQNFSDFAIFIPDKISSFTLRALGYSDSRIHHKIRKQDNYLRNKALKALDQLNYCSSSRKFSENKIVTLSDLVETPQYIKTYDLCIDMFNKNPIFRNGCLATSSWVLSTYEKTGVFAIDDYAKEIAVQYFMKELPIFLNASEILNVNSCSFVYNSIPNFLREVYDDYELVAKSQGFVIFKNMHN